MEATFGREARDSAPCPCERVVKFGRIRPAGKVTRAAHAAAGNEDSAVREDGCRVGYAPHRHIPGREPVGGGRRRRRWPVRLERKGRFGGLGTERRGWALRLRIERRDRAQGCRNE